MRIRFIALTSTIAVSFRFVPDGPADHVSVISTAPIMYTGAARRKDLRHAR
jgi:hypothetical protein